MSGGRFKKGVPRLPNAGRKKGTPNKTTAQLRELAQMHAADAIAMLAKLAVKADSDAARISAIKELLDRGYGKSTALHEVTGAEGAPLMPVTINCVPLPDPKQPPEV